MRLPGHQVRKSKTWPAKLLIEPDTKIMQCDLCRQARLKSAEVMGPFAIEAERMPELLIHGLHDLTHPSHPAPKPLGPRRSAIALRRAKDLGAIGLPPGLLVGVSFEALVDDIRPRGWGAHARQPRMGMAAQGKEGLGQGLIFGAGWPKAKAGDHPSRVDRHQQVESFIPAQAVAPADIGQARQPPRAPALGIARREAGAVQRFIRTLLRRQHLHQMQKTRDQRLMLLAYLAVELLPRRQAGEGGAQMTVRIAIKPALAAKALPLAEDGQGHHLAAREGRLRSRV